MWFRTPRKRRHAAPARPSRSYRVCLEVLEDRCLLSAGQLDTTFNPSGSPPGTVSTVFSKNLNSGDYAVALQSDGRIVAAGYGYNPKSPNVSYFELARYNTDGSLDSAFGSGGKVSTKMGAYVEGRAVAIQSDGKILEAGGLNNNWVIVRYNANGTLDTTFGGSGQVSPVFAQQVGGDNSATSLALETVNGVTKIVAAGWISIGSTGEDAFALARLNLDGTLDTTFGTGGEVVTDVTSGDDAILAAAIQSDGKIVAAGETRPGQTYQFAVARYNLDGTLDTTFNGTGVVQTAIGGGPVAEAVAIQSDGRIIVGGDSGNLARYTPGGALDSTFGQGGVETTGAGNIYGLSIQSNGKIVAATAGQTLARFNTDGSLDTTFGSGGYASSAPFGGRAVQLQSDGKIVVAGPNGGAFGVARYQGDAVAPAAATASTVPSAAVDALFADMRAVSILLSSDQRKH
jgi:uncharacterized delta-60 repeat protein